MENWCLALAIFKLFLLNLTLVLGFWPSKEKESMWTDIFLAPKMALAKSTPASDQTREISAWKKICKSLTWHKSAALSMCLYVELLLLQQGLLCTYQRKHHLRSVGDKKVTKWVNSTGFAKNPLQSETERRYLLVSWEEGDCALDS